MTSARCPVHKLMSFSTEENRKFWRNVWEVSRRTEIHGMTIEPEPIPEGCMCISILFPEERSDAEIRFSLLELS